MKTLLNLLTFCFAIGLISSTYAADPSPTSTTTKVIAFGTGTGEVPSAQTINAGRTLILVGTAPANTTGEKVTCCYDQTGVVRIPLTSFDQLTKYDIDHNGKIDANDTPYYGLFLAKKLTNGNFFTIQLRDDAIASIHLPQKEGDAPIVELKTKEKIPLVLVDMPATKN